MIYTLINFKWEQINESCELNGYWKIISYSDLVFPIEPRKLTTFFNKINKNIYMKSNGGYKILFPSIETILIYKLS